MGARLPDEPGNANCCKDCIAYLVHHGTAEAERCHTCGGKTLKWIQLSDGTFGLRCISCGASVVVDLNTPCEHDYTAFHTKTKVTLLPQKVLPPNMVIMKLGKLFEMNAVKMRNTLLQGSDISVDQVILEAILKLFKEHDITFQIDRVQGLKEKYPYYKQCKYPYSAMRIFFRNDYENPEWFDRWLEEK